MSFFRYGSFVLILALFSSLVRADPNSEVYGAYQGLLSDYLIEKTLPDGGLVSAFDYQAALAGENLEQRLSGQLQVLESFDPATLSGREESIAFWTNAYNFFMVLQILTEKPDGNLVTSVWDYGGRVNPFVDNVFEREEFVVGGRSYSLNDIEKGILLGESYADKGWKDARVHFAVNCASVGCPPLRDKLYTAENLEDLLAENTRRAFLTDYHLRVGDKTLFVSELFKWYEDDFEKAAGSRRAFIQEWVDPSLEERVAQTSSIEFIDYDWSLNKPSNFPEFQ